MLNTIKKIEYDLYLVLLGVLAFLSYTGLITSLLLPLYVVIALVLILKKKSVLYILPVALYLQLGFVELRGNVRVTTIYTVIFILLAGFDAIKNRRITKLGDLFIPLSILTGLSIITGINAPSLFSWFAGFTQMFSALLLYFYFVNTTENDKDNFIKISKMFLYLGVFVTLEMFHFIYKSDNEIIYIIQRRIIDLGWENINVVIYNNILGIPFVGYLIVKSKIKLPYMILALVSVLGIFLTLSRSSILTVGVLALLVAPLMLYYEKDKKSLFIQGAVFGLIIVSIGFIIEQNDLVTGYMDSLLGRDLLHFKDRWVLLVTAWEKLLEFPLFGSGGLYTSREFLNGPLNYHNTIAQVSTLGFTGIIAFIYLFFKKTKLILSKNHEIKWYLLIMIYVTAFVNGSLQPMYFYVSHLVVIFMILAVYENTDEAFNKEEK